MSKMLLFALFLLILMIKKGMGMAGIDGYHKIGNDTDENDFYCLMWAKFKLFIEQHRPVADHDLSMSMHWKQNTLTLSEINVGSREELAAPLPSPSQQPS